MGVTKLCFCLTLIELVSAYSAGAGRAACTDLSLMPGHAGVVQDQSQSLYSVVANSTMYAAGDVVEVKIEGTEAFKGFLLVASTVGGTTPLGTFSAASPTLSSFVQDRCEGDHGTGLTHQSTFNSNGNEQMQVVTHWQAPNSTEMGDIQFFATAVKTQTVYYTKIPGPILTALMDTTSTDTYTTTTNNNGGSSAASVSAPSASASGVSASGVSASGVSASGVTTSGGASAGSSSRSSASVSTTVTVMEPDTNKAATSYPLFYVGCLTVPALLFLRMM